MSGEFRRFTRISSNCVLIDKNKIDISDNCWIGPHSIIDGSNGVFIGRGVQLAGMNAIYTHSSHISIRLCGQKYIDLNPNERPGYIRSQVTIGEYTFIGVSSVILPGVQIGRGCILAAGTVLKKSVPDFSVVAGNPGKVIGSTLDMDKNYIQNKFVQENYFDLDLLKVMSTTKV